MNLFDIRFMTRLTKEGGGHLDVQPCTVFVIESIPQTTGTDGKQTFRNQLRCRDGNYWIVESPDDALKAMVATAGSNALLALKRLDKASGGVLIIATYVPSLVEDMPSQPSPDGTTPTPTTMIRSQLEDGDWLVLGTEAEVMGKLKATFSAGIVAG